MFNAAAVVARLSDEWLAHYFDQYPGYAAFLGLHQYDGRITDYRPVAIAARIQLAREFEGRLKAIDPSQLNQAARLDYELLRWQVAAELWNLVELRAYECNPISYAQDLAIDGYLKRDYAPLPSRVLAIIRHLQAIPQALEQAQANLQLPLCRYFVEESLAIYPALAAFLRHDLPAALQQLTDTGLLTELWRVRDLAVLAIDRFSQFLRTDGLLHAHQQFALGARRLQAMLAATELLTLPLDQLLSRGLHDLQANQATLLELAQQIDRRRTPRDLLRALGAKHPPAARLIPAARAAVAALRDFVAQHELLDLPGEGDPQVCETPQFMRSAFALMETAGPFEPQPCESYYYLTPPPASWRPAQAEIWMARFDYASLQITAAHEVYPGHYVHYLRLRQAPTRLASAFTSYAHTEGWAHYCEHMVVEQGYGDQMLRLAQLAEALLRNVRLICAVRMHADGMSIEQATRMFVEHAFLDPAIALREALRGTHDPGYLYYTLGKLLFLDLRDQLQRRLGARFSLKHFHEACLSYGAPPLPILRGLLLAADA